VTQRIVMRIAGLRWTVRVAGHGRPVLLFHGFTGSSRSWAGLAGLGGRFRAIVPDLPGHGGTGWEADEEAAGTADPDARPRASIERTADEVAVLVRRLGARRLDVVGYSMGARVALRLAVARPDLVDRLVLESPSAGLADPAARAERRAADAALARVALAEGIEAFARRWEASPVMAGEAALAGPAAELQRSIRRAGDVRGLAASLLEGGQGAMEPLHRRLGAIASPTLVVVGARDPARRSGEEVAAAIPGARLVVVEGAGHAPHLERPERFHAVVLDFLTEARP